MQAAARSDELPTAQLNTQNCTFLSVVGLLQTTVTTMASGCGVVIGLNSTQFCNSILQLNGFRVWLHPSVS